MKDIFAIFFTITSLVGLNATASAEEVVKSEWCIQQTQTYTLNTAAGSDNYVISKSAREPNNVSRFDVMVVTPSSNIYEPNVRLESVVNNGALTNRRVWRINNCIR